MNIMYITPDEFINLDAIVHVKLEKFDDISALKLHAITIHFINGDSLHFANRGNFYTEGVDPDKLYAELAEKLPNI